MNIEHLRAFLEVAATGSFQLAAEKMHITQSTTSARIKTLEDRLNQPLFVRKRNGAVLTSAGQQLHRHALTSVQAWERARQEIALPEEMIGVYSLGIQLNHWDLVATPWMKLMRQRSPDIATRVISDYSEALMRKLRDGLLDIAVLYAPQQRPNLVVRKYVEESIVLVTTLEGSIDHLNRPDYVFVDWGDNFREQHHLEFPAIALPHLSVGLGSVGLSHILQHGGSGYFLYNMVKSNIESGQLQIVRNAPVFHHQTWLAYPEEPLDLTLHGTAMNMLQKIALQLSD